MEYDKIVIGCNGGTKKYFLSMRRRENPLSFIYLFIFWGGSFVYAAGSLAYQ